MANSLSGLWKDIRGNAIWDAIKWLWAMGGSGVTLVLQWVSGHQNMMALLLNVGALVFFGVVALIIRKNPAPHSRATKPAETPPSASAALVIISAKWGIGGNAYKDVTDTVRVHASPDSVKIPASKGLLEDPYPGEPKTLTVEYSFARKWWIDIPEGNTLELPEKDGQEYARVQTEKAKARLAEITRGADNPNRSYLEAQAFTELRGEFVALSWAKKVAVKLLCLGIPDELTLRLAMQRLGFGTEGFILHEIIPSLRTCNLLEYKPDNGSLRPHPARLRDVEEIVAEWNFEFKPPLP